MEQSDPTTVATTNQGTPAAPPPNLDSVPITRIPPLAPSPETNDLPPPPSPAPAPEAILVQEPDPSVTVNPEGAVAVAAPEPPVEYTTVLLAPSGSRRLVESALIFLGTILFLRAIAVEPFGVPTGSMAPTLTGNHKCVQCPRCNYPVRVGETPTTQPRSGQTVTCPNCGKPGLELDSLVEVAGDRLLVDKNIFDLRKPRRWEVAVFRCPSDLTKPYVKRVVALPGEVVYLHDGDVYINGQISRKSFADCREARVPVFDLNFPPQPVGWQHRWQTAPRSIEANLPQVTPWFLVDGKELRFQCEKRSDLMGWATYQHARYDERTGEDRQDIIRDGFAYNGQQLDESLQAAHDFSVEFEIEILGGNGLIGCRLTDGRDEVHAVYPVGTDRESLVHHEGFGKVRSVSRKPLQAGKSYKIEMSFCDRRVLFAIDGKQIFEPYDLAAVEARAEVSSPLALGVRGVTCVVRNLRIYRDIYYRSSGKHGTDKSNPLPLGNDEYFMLGDNSSNSDDSRSWKIPGVPERNFLGKPFLLHQPSRTSRSSWSGQDKFYQTIDWSRIRWLR